ncbi:hypothetical protein [Rhodanobacter glycinis]|uniref:Uncharacterized protein n=1 Tax=Rhodanobacter glycinis TaxID=582702 RepID=A0A1I4F6Q0_9GAMM|nr:hypothetical protein [Rhodanobacter glycinis]SFL12517.1 hypothetical protein SAMN05192579_11581 [Rhodanobacter glycinis]
MTTRSNKSKEQFEKAIDFLVEDIAHLTSAAVEASLQELGIDENMASSMVKEATESCRHALGVERLALAKQQLREPHRGSVTAIDGARAKAVLRDYWQRHPSEVPTTLAARKGAGVSDDTALKMYQSLVELGAISPDEGPGNV